MQRSARLCSVILTVAWTAFTLFAVIVPEDPMARHGWLLLALALVACGGLLIAWRLPQIGGGIALVAGVAYMLVNWIANASLATFLGIFGLLIAGPFILTGLAFVLSNRARTDGPPGSPAWAGLLPVLIAALVLATVALWLGLGIGRVTAWPTVQPDDSGGSRPVREPAVPTVTPAKIGSPAPTAAPEAVATAVSAQPTGDLLPPTNGLTHTWRDYETALVRAILPPTLANGVCDWQVLGHTGQEVYVWAFCAARQPGADIAAASVPAVLALAGDGHTITARIPRDGTYYPEDVRTLFPADVQQRVFDRPSTEMPARLAQHARRRLILSTLPPLGAAEIVRPRPEISATGAHIALYSGREDPRWDLNELDLAQLDALLEGLSAIDCPPMPDQLGYRGVVVGLGMADESRMTAYGGTLWFGYAGANPQATCLADTGRAVERFLLGSAQPYLDPQVFNAITADLTLPVPTPLVTPSPTPTLAPGFVRDADEGFGVQFARPGNWELCQGTGLSRLYCVAGPPTENSVAPPTFYFTLLPPGSRCRAPIVARSVLFMNPPDRLWAPAHIAAWAGQVWRSLSFRGQGDGLPSGPTQGGLCALRASDMDRIRDLHLPVDPLDLLVGR